MRKGGDGRFRDALERTADEIRRVAGPDFARAPVAEYLRMRDAARGLRDELREAMADQRCPPAAAAAWEERLRFLGEAGEGEAEIGDRERVLAGIKRRAEEVLGLTEHDRRLLREIVALCG